MPHRSTPWTVLADHLDAGSLARLAATLPPSGEYFGRWYRCALSSVFQEVIDPVSGRIVGREAFLRSAGNGARELSPWSLFSANASDERLVAFDRLVRVMHALNFAPTADNQLLFLNVHGRLLAAVEGDHGAFFRKLLAVIGLTPEQVVIETPQTASQQTDLLAYVLRNFRNNGFRVAVKVDSAAQWQLIAPRIGTDFVKIDARSVLDEAGADSGGLDELAAIRGSSRLILTHLERPLPTYQQRPGLWAQGFAYGLPRPQSAAARLSA